jgi:hypothetical protein
MKKQIVNIGEQFNNWTIIEDLGINPTTHKHQLKCKCSCGNICITTLSNIKRSKTCGHCNVKQIRIGDKFGKWTVISEPFMSNGKKYYQCQCECGTIKSLNHYKLINGKTTSCGCGRIVLHDKTDRRLYDVLHHMKDRCYNPLNKKYKDYGARGITICDEWLDSNNGLDAFIKWSYDNGYDKNAQYGECTIDRIDVNGNYEPSNCRWANSITQGNNKRNNVLLTYNGETHTITEWSNIIGINRDTIDARYRHGLSIDKILSPHLLK